jgi:hypothetical protein
MSIAHSRRPMGRLIRLCSPVIGKRDDASTAPGARPTVSRPRDMGFAAWRMLSPEPMFGVTLPGRSIPRDPLLVLEFAGRDLPSPAQKAGDGARREAVGG